jgi:hypothetical protein
MNAKAMQLEDGLEEIRENQPSSKAPKLGPVPLVDLSLDDFRAFMPDHRYIFMPSRSLWPAASVNSRLEPVDMGVDDKGKRLLVPASHWLDKNRPIEEMTWAPGWPMVIENKLVSGGGWREHKGCSCFNLYIPPTIAHGDSGDVSPWLDHVRRIYPDAADHIISWLAHRVQKPGEKINHAIVLGGAQGIGKDTILEPVKHAVGPWNFVEVSPDHLFGRFTGWMKSVILRVSEARDLGEVDRFAFYDHMKTYTAAPPDVLRCDEKNIREYDVMNVMGVIITTNHKADGIYLPADDRRHYVAWSTLSRADFPPDYFRDLYRWYVAGGNENVAAYLANLDISAFDPKAPPPKTDAFHDIVDANRAPEDSELADALDALSNPPAVTLADIAMYATEDFKAWLIDRRNRRQIPHRLDAAGYAPCRNSPSKDGLWKVYGRRQVIYTLKSLTVPQALVKAAALAGKGSGH